MTELPAPTVRLDGPAIRQIREQKKLTQLYVAKVVGVTTDTISRWENNRYPSIKRDNALRLAEALEVPLDDLLQPPPEAVAEMDSAVESGGRNLTLWGLCAAILLLVGGLWLYLGAGGGKTAGPSGIRLLPRHAAPGTLLPVRVRLQGADPGGRVILREKFPPSWQLVEASPEVSSLDNEEGAARWIIQAERPEMIVSYLLKVPEKLPLGQIAPFAGDIVSAPRRDSAEPVRGDTRLEVAPYLWADTDGDSVVDDGEMLDASYVFDEMTPLPLGWEVLEGYWDAGSYHWDAGRRAFVPGPAPDSKPADGRPGSPEETGPR